MASVNATYFNFIDNRQLLTTAVAGQRVPHYISRSYMLEQQRRLKAADDAQRAAQRAAEHDRRRRAEVMWLARDHERRAALEVEYARAHVKTANRAYTKALDN